MNNAVLGIDLGTSALKILYIRSGKVEERSRSTYEDENVPGCWMHALERALSSIGGLDVVTAVGLSGQVGTYFINDKHLISWQNSEGGTFVEEIALRYPAETFISQIGMVHPRLASYPLPRLCYARQKYGPVRKVLQPKDVITGVLTGRPVSDPYSWRGLANAASCRYSGMLLKDAGISEDVLPVLRQPWVCAGTLTQQAAAATGLPAGIPVYTGMNDFYAALLGMGMTRTGDWFDITGTSEHLGLLEEDLCKKTKLISSPYLTGYVHYGVTGSTGVSLSFGACTFPEVIGETLTDVQDLIEDAPVFLPYLNGERAPIFDSEAKGTFFGITGKTTSRHMAYSVKEGVAFSLYHIYCSISEDRCKGSSKIRVSGGAAGDLLLCALKAELMQKELVILEEPEASAFGAGLTAMIGQNEISGPEEAASFVRTARIIRPDGHFRGKLLKRYGSYLDLYRRVKGLKI